MGEEQEQSLCVGEGGAGWEEPILIDHEQEEGGVDGAQAVIGSKNMSNDGEGVEIVEQREVNNSGQGGEGEAHLDENQNKKSDQDLINNEAEDPVVEKFCHRNLKENRCLYIIFKAYSDSHLKISSSNSPVQTRLEGRLAQNACVSPVFL